MFASGDEAGFDGLGSWIFILGQCLDRIETWGLNFFWHRHDVQEIPQNLRKEGGETSREKDLLDVH